MNAYLIVTLIAGIPIAVFTAWLWISGQRILWELPPVYVLMLGFAWMLENLEKQTVGLMLLIFFGGTFVVSTIWGFWKTGKFVW